MTANNERWAENLRQVQGSGKLQTIGGKPYGLPIEFFWGRGYIHNLL